MQNTIQMFTIGICYKDLSKVITCHQFNYLLYTRRIQFIENVIQQQYVKKIAYLALSSSAVCG